MSSIVEAEVGFSPKPSRRRSFEAAGETHETVTPTSAPGGRKRNGRLDLYRRKISKHLTASGRR